MNNTWTIEKIQSMLEADAMAIAEEKIETKGHDCYFIDFDNCFGYSVCVFCEGRHIYYANDYELHHRGKTHEDLRKLYLEHLNKTLYTEDELSEPLKSYEEYRAKSHFLHNHYGMRREYESIFCIIHSEEEREIRNRKIASMFFNPICFCYNDSKEFVKQCADLNRALENRYKETFADYEFQKSAFYYELANHEYHINTYQGDWDTLSVFGKIEWHGQGAEAREIYFDELNFTDIQRKAFNDARKEFLSTAYKNGWY